GPRQVRVLALDIWRVPEAEQGREVDPQPVAPRDRREGLIEPLFDSATVVGGYDANMGSEDVTERCVGRASPIGGTPSLQPGDRSHVAHVLRERRQGPALADAALTHHPHQDAAGLAS